MMFSGDDTVIAADLNVINDILDDWQEWGFELNKI